MEIDLDGSALKTPLLVVLTVVLLSINGWVGTRVTPHSSEGELLLLTPRLWQRYRFLQITETQIETLIALDQAVLESDLTTTAQLAEQALRLADSIAVVPGPHECVPVRTQLEDAAWQYHEAANAAVQAHLDPSYDPTPDLNQARRALSVAQQQWAALQP
jgi:hypothetical protein